jgi:MFS transporter, UMF1 family
MAGLRQRSGKGRGWMTDQTDRRGVTAWMLFDWANQPFHTLIVTFIFAPYFASTVVGDPVRGQALWGTALSVAGAITAISAPLLGAIADRTGARKPWVLAFSLPFVLGVSGLWAATPGLESTRLVLLCFGLAYVTSELTLVFTNAMLPDLASGRETGRVSGSGWALGYVGGLVSLVLVLALIAPATGSDRTLAGIAPILGLEPEAGEPARATGPLCAIWFAAFALPFFLFTPDSPRRGTLVQAVPAGLADLRGTLREVRRHGRLFRYLIASMLYRDGLAALFAFGGIYAAGVLGWGVFELGLFGIVAAAVGALGAWVGGQTDAAYGPLPVISASIWTLIAVCLITLATDRQAILFTPVGPNSPAPDAVFFLAGALLGAASGALQAASRTMLVREAEGHVESGQAFGLYALSGRVTAFIGPALVSATTATTGSQRLGVSPLILLFGAGLILLHSLEMKPER